MKANELVKGKWYKSTGTHKHFDTIYFLFREMKSNEIFAGMNPDIEEVYITIENNSDISVWKLFYNYPIIRYRLDCEYEEAYFEEVDYSDIMKMIPDNHPYKKVYLRKQKIKSLLNGI